MAYIRFNNNGYEYHSKARYLLFTANNTHDYLFDYVNKDLSPLSELLKQYISKRINTRTLELKRNSPHEHNELNEIKKILADAHPFYKHEYKNVIARAIGDYFNTQFLYLCFHESTVCSDPSEKWYSERINELLRPLLTLGDTFRIDFYNELQKQICCDEWDSESENVIINIPHKEAVGFSHELQVQKYTANALYLILDISAPELKQLTLSQRSWLHNKIFYMDYCPSEFNIPIQHSFFRTPKFNVGDRSLEKEQPNKSAEIFEPLYKLNNVNILLDGIPTNIAEHLSLAVESAKLQTPSEVYTEYRIDSLQQLLYLEIATMIQSGTMIRRCRRCGKYFVVTNHKIAYCNRVDESGLCCSSVGSQQNYQKRLESDEALKIYNRAYKTHYARVKKGSMSQDAFRLWYDEAKSKLAKVRIGKLDLSDFQTWLKK